MPDQHAWNCFAVAFIRWENEEDWLWSQELWDRLKKAKNEPHCGDCTNVPHTCYRCSYEEIDAFATEAVKLLSRPMEIQHVPSTPLSST